ncbi:MAG: glycosyltransferase [Planctomycetota bacterium]
MLRICHLIDQSAGWEQRTAIDLILRRTTSNTNLDHALATIAPGNSALKPLDRAPTVTAHGDRLPWFAAVGIARHVKRIHADVVHVWGLQAALAACAAKCPRVLLTLFDPYLAAAHAKRIRTLCREPGFAVACSSETVVRRLVENGVPQDKIVTIRPGIDFAFVHRTRKSKLRTQLGMETGDRLAVLHEATSQRDCQLEAFWAVKLVHYLDSTFHCAVSDRDVERDRLRRFESGLIGRPALLRNTRDIPFEALICIADAFVLASRKDVSTTAIALAMAAETIVVGPATHSIAEIIGSGLNGCLYKQEPNRNQALSIIKCLRTNDEHRKLKEVARGHAYEVFAAQRNADQYVRLYENLMASRPPGDGIIDSAISA